MPDEQPRRREANLYLAISQVGLEMVAPIGVGLALDFWLGTIPWITVGGVFLGFFGGIAHLLKLVNRLDRNDKQGQPQDQP